LPILDFSFNIGYSCWFKNHATEVEMSIERYTGVYRVVATCAEPNCNFHETNSKIVDTESTNNGEEPSVMSYTVEKTVPFDSNMSEEKKAEITERNKNKFATLPNLIKEGLLATNSAHRDHLHDAKRDWHGFVGKIMIEPEKEVIGLPFSGSHAPSLVESNASRSGSRKNKPGKLVVLRGGK